MAQVKIIKIIGVKEWQSGGGHHVKTSVLLSDGEEAWGYGRFEVGESVERFYDETWDVVKIQRKKRSLDSSRSD